MSDLLQQLQDDESVLLMYLAGELPGEDRAEVERRLLADADLRGALHTLRETQNLVLRGLGRLDDASPLPVEESAVVRGAATAIRQWQAGRARQATRAASAPAAGRAPSRWRIWAIPSAAAALVLLVLGISFYGHSGHGRPLAKGGHNPVSPAGGPAITEPGGSGTGIPSPAGASADDLVGLLAMNTHEIVEAASDELPASTASTAMPADRDPAREDAGSREDGGDVKPVFDIPLDVGQ